MRHGIHTGWDPEVAEQDWIGRVNIPCDIDSRSAWIDTRQNARLQLNIPIGKKFAAVEAGDPANTAAHGIPLN